MNTYKCLCTQIEGTHNTNIVHSAGVECRSRTPRGRLTERGHLGIWPMVLSRVCVIQFSGEEKLDKDSL